MTDPKENTVYLIHDPSYNQYPRERGVLGGEFAVHRSGKSVQASLFVVSETGAPPTLRGGQSLIPSPVAELRQEDMVPLTKNQKWRAPEDIAGDLLTKGFNQQAWNEVQQMAKMRGIAVPSKTGDEATASAVPEHPASQKSGIRSVIPPGIAVGM